MRAAFLAIVVSAVGCSAAEKPAEVNASAQPGDNPSPKPTPAPQRRVEKAPIMKPALSDALEADLAAIRKNPGEAVGFGLKAYAPYEPTTGSSLINSSATEVTDRLLAEARGDGDRVYRLAVLHLLGKRSDAAVDAALTAALDVPALCATAAYLLGREGYKGYPRRPREVAAVRAALRKHLDDATTFEDPFYRRTFRTQDFVLAAYVRVTGPERFQIANRDLAELIGLGLPEFSDAIRADLLSRAKQIE